MWRALYVGGVFSKDEMCQCGKAGGCHYRPCRFDVEHIVVDESDTSDDLD